MTQSKYLITTTNTPNSIVKRDQAGDIQGNAIFLTDQIQAASVTAFDFLDAAGAALFIDGAAATFQVPVVNANYDISGLSLTAGLGGISNGGVITHSYTNIGTISSNQDLSFESFTVIELTVGAGITLSNTVCPPAGTECTLILVTSGATSRTVIFSAANFRTTGSLATGTLTGRRFVLTFVSDGTELVEKSRTTASV